VRSSPTAAFFDLDDTLLAGDSDLIWYDYLAGLGRIGWRDRLWVRWHYWRYHLGHGDVDTYTAMQTRTIAGLPVEEVRAAYADCFSRITRYRLFAAALDLISRHAGQGHRLVLCTGANSLRCEPVRRHLELDAVLGTELEITDDRCSGRIVGTYCTGAEKVARIEQYARAHGVDLTVSYAYGDSQGDRLMLEAVGNPVAVNPNRGLEAIARQRGWPILRFNGLAGRDAWS
jgi:HAD superfamily hydrolase (TIGR01490 family)